MNLAIARRNHRQTRIKTIRSLTPADLELLRLKPIGPQVKFLKDSHHRIAELIVLGKTNAEIGAMCGMSLGRIVSLKNDPAFQELLARKRADRDEIWRDNVDFMASLATSNMIKAERQLGDALDEADHTGTAIPLRDLARITSDRMDRFGYGKHTTQTNLNIGFAAKLEGAIQRARQAREID